MIKLVRSGTFACYGDMTVTMDKGDFKAEGPIDGKKLHMNISSEVPDFPPLILLYFLNIAFSQIISQG